LEPIWGLFGEIFFFRILGFFGLRRPLSQANPENREIEKKSRKNRAGDFSIFSYFGSNSPKKKYFDMRPSPNDRKNFFLSIGEGPIQKKSKQKIEKSKKPKIANLIIHSFIHPN
jgi:hypothetical protein